MGRQNPQWTQSATSAADGGRWSSNAGSPLGAAARESGASVPMVLGLDKAASPVYNCGVRKIRGFGAEGIPAHPDRVVLALYALDPLKADANFPEGTPPIIAFGVSFPGSNSDSRLSTR